MVGHHVVQLAGDVGALVEHGPARPLVALGLGGGQALLDLRDVLPPRAGGPSGHPRERHGGQPDGGCLDQVGAVAARAEHEEDERQERATTTDATRRSLHEPMA